MRAVPGAVRCRAPSRGGDGGCEVLVLAGGGELGDLRGDRAGVGDRADVPAVGDGRGPGGRDRGGGAGQYPGSRGSRPRVGPHRAGHVAGNPDAEGRGGHPAALDPGEGPRGRQRPGGTLRVRRDGLPHPEPTRRGGRGDDSLGAASGAGLAQRAGQPPRGGLLGLGGLAGDPGGFAGPVSGVAGEDLGGGVPGLTPGLVFGLAGLSLAGGNTGGGANSAAEAAATRAAASPTASATGDGGPPTWPGSALGAGWSRAMPRIRHQRWPSRTMALASSSRVAWASRQTRRLSQLAGADRGGDRPGDGLGLGCLEDARVTPREDQGGSLAGFGRGSGGGEVADHDLAGAGTQPGLGRRATWRASIWDSSSAVAAADQAALVPAGARQREWAACAHSCTVAPHKAG